MDTEHVHIIAEAGTNHNGDLKTALRLVDAAVQAGADSVKFQIIYPEGLYLPGDFTYGSTTMDKVIAMRRRLMLSDDEYVKLAAYAVKQGIGFSASVFDKRGLDLLAGFKPGYIKIASTDLNNLQLLRKAAEKGIRIIISTGMSELEEIERSVNELRKSGCEDIVLLHCVSVYPAALEDMNLGYIDELRSAFGLPVGLSDHTTGNLAACMAVAKGISFIEKHFTLDSKQEGFDHSYALEPAALKEFVKDIRRSRKALEKPERKLGEKEVKVKDLARRSLYAARDISRNDVLTEEDILVVRPPNVLAADQIDAVIGRKLKKDIKKYQPLSLEILE